MSSRWTDGPRTIYFLGAGATAAAIKRAPLTDSLLAQVLAQPPASADGNDVGLVTELVRLLSSWGNEPTVDDLLSLIDVAVAGDLSLAQNWPARRLADARLSLTRLIYRCIDAAVHVEESLDGPLVPLLRACADPAEGGVVTLNWDCLVERTFVRVVGQADGMVDYGLDTVNHAGSSNAVWGGALLVLKPHGSLSWGHCPLCDVVVADLVKPFQFAGDRHCPRCLGTGLGAVLVPPVMSGYRPTFLDAIWTRVEAVVRTCDRLIFIGYSFPPQDVDVRVHLVRALAQRSLQRTRPPLQVCVVTRADPDRPQLAAAEERRYRAMLSGHVSHENLKFAAHPQGFAGWMSGRAS